MRSRGDIRLRSPSRRALRGIFDPARSERGQTFVEYVMLLALLAVVISVAVVFVGPVLRDVYQTVAETIGVTGDADACEGGDDDPSDPDCD